ncbi:elongation factor P hydroxylase [Cognaticolwellia mytili]|uniref:elongation factor P hydroxylase n=1 Tax=Cognaticolwellia mytili TaxID=1888913 RepID=UPI000A171DC0|nr:elongation factor P hydroxylase [Cognaticolwellia mytili]
MLVNVVKATEVVHHFQDLISLFETTFFQQYNTRLVKGDKEPVYLPVSETCEYNQIVFAHGYYASALHEISHWCLAGSARRLLEDFGYWYLPDGRDQQQQIEFEKVEIKPQAIEWALCVAVGKKFDVSTDNLSGSGQTDRFAFKDKVYQQVCYYLEDGFPSDAEKFIMILAKHYQRPWPLKLEYFESLNGQ